MKTEETYRLEEIITLETYKPNMIGCAEVGLGDLGIVDYITVMLDKTRTIRCYELKITKSDFLSDAKKSFVGDYNFYVIPTELWSSVKAYIEPWVGCWTIDKNGKAHRKKPAQHVRPQITWTQAVLRTTLALQRQHLKYVEKDWQDIQLAKPITDYNSKKIAIGSIVRYHGRQWRVADITRERMETVLMPICHIEPYGWEGNGEDVKPSVLRLVT